VSRATTANGNGERSIPQRENWNPKTVAPVGRPAAESKINPAAPDSLPKQKHKPMKLSPSHEYGF